MAVNPMQRKTRISFLIGVLITLLVTGVVIVLLFLKVNSLQKDIDAEQAKKKKIYVLNQDVKSGQSITEDMFMLKQVDGTTIPETATNVIEEIDSWYLQLKDGTPINTGTYYYNQRNEEVRATSEEEIAGVATHSGLYYLDVNGNEVRVYQDENTYNYYTLKTENGAQVKEYIDMNNVPVIAKIDLQANTIMTPNLVEQTNEVTTDDLRREEFNTIVLPMDLLTGDYIDVRLMLPNGQNFIVVSKKSVEIPIAKDGTYMADTIWLKLREDEMLVMSSAIIEAAGINGAKLYAVKYTEPGLQDAAIPTYRPNNATASLIGMGTDGNPTNPNLANMLESAKAELRKRYTSFATDARTNYLQSLINENESFNSNVEAGLSQSATNSTEARQQYLEAVQQAGGIQQ